MRQAKKTPKGQSCKGFPLHQWGTSMERCIPPPPSQPQDRAELGDRIQAQPHGRKTTKRLLYRRAFACSPP